MEEKKVVQLKVGAKSKPKDVAGAIAGSFKDGAEKVVMTTIGAGALNESVKAIIIARGYLSPVGVDLKAVPSFETLQIEGNERTAIAMVLERD